MENNKSKFLARVAAGMFGGTVLGIFTWLEMMNYGGNNGCWPSIDRLTGMVGYESCGFFGAISGILVGAILGVLIMSVIKTANQLRIAIWLALAAFIVPFLYGVILFWPPFQDGDILIAPPITLIFMVASLVPSALIAWVISLTRK
jgi:hypothetical protein